MKDRKKLVGVTGSTGFVGKRFMAMNATAYELLPIQLRTIDVAELSLAGVDTIVHLAGKAHQMEPIDDAEYFSVNTALTSKLASAAKEQGVSQFIYFSSTKVYGDAVSEVLTEESVCVPSDAYGRSKKEAEEFLIGLQSSTFRVAIIRPPLVYGPEVKGNMIRLLNLAAKGYPLPFGRTGNARSMVFVDNLVALTNAIISQHAAGVFLGGDRKALSTDELIRQIRQEMGMPPRLIPIPTLARTFMKKFRPHLYTRLFGSFELNTADTNRRLNFVPPFTSSEGIHDMVEWYKKSQG